MSFFKKRKKNNDFNTRIKTFFSKRVLSRTPFFSLAFFSSPFSVFPKTLLTYLLLSFHTNVVTSFGGGGGGRKVTFKSFYSQKKVLAREQRYRKKTMLLFGKHLP